MSISIKYGRELLPDALPEGRQWLVLTAQPVAEKLGERTQALGGEVRFVPGVDEDVLQDWERELPGGDAVLGIGGGVCMDAAKYVAWQRELPLWLAPSIISVDACLTETIGIRRERRVAYVGETYPESVLVDYSLIQNAPEHLNRAGAGDILSIHTALWDWELAAREMGDDYDAALAAESRKLLDRLNEAADEVKAVSEEGIRTLVELYSAEVELCRRAGSSRPEEGSEHFWAYNAEYCTKRPYIHGELVALGVLLMAALQENELDRIRGLIKQVGIRRLPEEVGISEREIAATLMTARDYADMDGLPYSVLTARPVSLDLAVKIVEQITS